MSTLAYLAQWAEFAQDPFCPELSGWNVTRLSDLWQRLVDDAGHPVTLPFWAVVWPGARALARYILDHPAVFQGQTVLDLACGSGLATVAAAKVGARAIGVDIDPQAVDAARDTASRNQVEAEFYCGQAFQRDFPMPPETSTILAADVFYEFDLAEQASAWLCAQTVPVFVADPMRLHRPRDRFESIARYHIPVLPEIEGVRIIETEILRPLI